MWWNPDFLFRRQLQITPPPDGAPVGHPVTFTVPTAITDNNKVLEDFEDIEVIWVNPLDGLSYQLDRVVNADIDGTMTGVSFLLQSALIDTSLDYYLYYGGDGPALSRTMTVFPIWPHSEGLDSTSLTFTRPGEHWVEGVATVSGARATLRFFGERIRLVSKMGPNEGIVEVQLDEGPWEDVDLYAIEESVISVWSKEDIEPGYHEVRVRVANRQHPASTGFGINIVQFDMSKAIEVDDLGEEVIDLAWSTVTGGE